MTKYSTKFKIKIVKEYWLGGMTLHDLMLKYSIPTSIIIRRWVKQADEHGLESLKVKYNKRTYPQSFKLDVVNYVNTNEVSQLQAAAHFGISASQVNSWCRIFQETGVTGLRDKPRGRPTHMVKSKNRKAIKRLKPTAEEKYKEEIMNLKAELHQAEMERDILKVLATIKKDQKNQRNPRKKR